MTGGAGTDTFVLSNAAITNGPGNVDTITDYAAGETVDITHAESAGRWRELLEGAGVKRAAVAGRGLFKDAATDALMRQTFFDGTVRSYQVVIPDFGTIEGAFQIASLEFAGEHNGEVTYELSLESAGALTFAGFEVPKLPLHGGHSRRGGAFAPFGAPAG
jgi:TP901-1 family phage major tail protein